MTKNHASFLLEVKEHFGIEPKGSIELELNGCRDCLVKAMADMLCSNKSFKDFVNESVRLANEIRAKEQN